LVPGAGFGYAPAHCRATSSVGLGAGATDASAPAAMGGVDRMPDMSAADNETATGATAPISPVMSSSVGNKLGLGLLWLVALLGVAGSALLWQKLSRMQEQLARQSADAGQQSVEAKAWAKQAQETVKDNTARLAQAEGKLAELGLQRTQIEELMQSMSRSRDENLVLDIESSLRLAQQQADMTGNAEPLVAALQTAQLRIKRSTQPRLAPLARGIEKDLQRLQAFGGLDLPGLLLRLDEAVGMIDGLPISGLNVQVTSAPAVPASAVETPGDWLGQWGVRVLNEFKSLVRVRRVDTPEAMLMSPEQGYFLKENLKLKLLNARLGVLSHQYPAARKDLSSVFQSVKRFADPEHSKSTQLLQLLEQLQQMLSTTELPRLDASMVAVNTLATGR
ncbi:MAG: putative uroporphyrinogen-III C-methyltransferase, partial [Pseudomonadota bacterium]